ncbi:MAG TPA: DUF2298 domain-containing protein [Ktedonobacteraceae bacterium]|jgi:YYY domain-containing protein|nr:DUF2298 domain-containing protein [Ktedonobacteraceae bacterium]
MFEILQMWALVEVIGLLCLPLTVTVFHNLPDRGWAFSKVFGVFIFAFVVWFPLMCLHFLPFNRGFIAGVALVLLACSVLGFIRTRQTIVKVVRLNRTYVIVVELLFLGMIFLLGWLRSFNPDIHSWEMYMDEGFISAIMRSPHLPPNDMWFSGYSINYYYYAHYIAAMLGMFLGQPASVVFNTGIAMYYGLTAVSLFGVTSNVIAWARYQRKKVRVEHTTLIEKVELAQAPLLKAIPYGVATVLMGLVLGNLAATQGWWMDMGGGPSYDWFSPSRVIPNTINEFPAFSFLLSCFHAHVLTLAFTILAIGMAFNLLLETDGKGLNAFGQGWRLPCTLVTTAVVLGGLFAMNGWDYPTYLGLALVCMALQQWRSYQGKWSTALALDVIAAAISLIALSLLLFLPFWLTFVSPAEGIGLVAAKDRSPIRDEVLIYGLFAFIFLSFLVVSALMRPLFKRTQQDGEQENEDGRGGLLPLAIWFGALLIIDIMVLLLVPNSTTLVIFGSMTVIAVLLLFYHVDDRAHLFTLLAGAVAFVLVAGCEVLFLRDVFADTLPRMNTLFKFYFQAWSLLAIASGCSLFFIFDSFRMPAMAPAVRTRVLRWSVQGVWCVLLALLVLASAVYPLMAPAARLAYQNAQTNQDYWKHNYSLNGITYLQSCQLPYCEYNTAGDYYALNWINANIQGDPVIIESIGQDYHAWGRVSTFTGLPTPMGWVGHEYQWRVGWLNKGNNAAEFNRRSGDIDTIYTNSDPQAVLSTMAHYHAQYLYVGALEFVKYPKADLQRFGSFMQVVYAAHGVTIYKVR